MKQQKNKLLLLSVFTATTLFANNQPNIGDVLKEIKPPKIEKKKKELPLIEQETKSFQESFKDGKKVYIQKFLISGAKHMSNQELKTIVKPYEKKNLSFKDIQEITNLITLTYQKKGYFVARAYIPIQNIKNQKNILKIQVIEGKYGKFHLENNSLVKNEVLQNNLDEIKKSEVISQKSLQRGLLIINDTPGVRVTKTKIKPGEEVGSSDFIIGTVATSKYSGYLIADNYGSDYTGKHRVMAGVDINSPFKIGDKVSISALSSQNTNLLNGRIAYDFPIYKNGLRGEVAFSKTTYELGSSYKELDALGYANSITAKISYPYIRSNSLNLETYLSTSYNKMKDKMKSTSTQVAKDTLISTLGLDFSNEAIIYSKYSSTNVNLSISAGRLNFKDIEDKQNDENGANTNGTFSKINLDFNQDFSFTESFTWKNKLQLQYALADKNLDGSEDLSIGGINGVKLYPQGEESGENGYIFGTEFLYTLPSFKGFNSKLGVFYDIARVHMSDKIEGEEFRTLQDAGISFYASYKEFFINSYFAHKVGNKEVTSEDDFDSVFLFQAGWMF